MFGSRATKGNSICRRENIFSISHELSSSFSVLLTELSAELDASWWQKLRYWFLLWKLCLIPWNNESSNVWFRLKSLNINGDKSLLTVVNFQIIRMSLKIFRFPSHFPTHCLQPMFSSAYAYLSQILRQSERERFNLKHVECGMITQEIWNYYMFQTKERNFSVCLFVWALSPHSRLRHWRAEGEERNLNMKDINEAIKVKKTHSMLFFKAKQTKQQQNKTFPILSILACRMENEIFSGSKSYVALCCVEDGDTNKGRATTLLLSASSSRLKISFWHFVELSLGFIIFFMQIDCEDFNWWVSEDNASRAKKLEALQSDFN